MDTYETSAKHNLAETCSASISLNDLLALAPKKDLIDYSQKQVYGAIRGTEALRTNIANLYSQPGYEHTSISAEGVLVTNGAIQANFLALYTNVGPGDHVICQYPTYQQLYSVPETFGAEVSLWRSEEGKGWGMNLETLRTLVKSNTKMIILKYVQILIYGLRLENDCDLAIRKIPLELFFSVKNYRSLLILHVSIIS
jgi:aspartate/methionine/tyrosine aminotransferase